MKGCDAFKIVQVEETASACTARVLKPLDCAHKVAMECSQWKQSPGAMQRVSKLRTVHPRNGMAGHSFFLRLCSSTTRLQTVIKGTQRVLSDKSLTLYVVEYSQQAGLSRSEAEVAGTIQRRHRFELKTLNEENFLRIAGSEKAHVVFGHLYSAKYLINPVDIPTSKGKKSTANIRAWVTRQSSPEDKRDNLSIILSGHEDGIQKKLYAYNDGRPSRFNEVVFEDFDSQELEVEW
ncbi:hypothetical protein PC118_g19268 [Phytophthora cactorum]|uniref:Uncharacterized protein n=1 Tax=Phytophthora cactorum TaxID=29920 RepID=A0A8T1FAP9_9STRA|nr:hypothetical protein PC118_g19268 [Phytophthora cactorum]